MCMLKMTSEAVDTTHHDAPVITLYVLVLGRTCTV